MGPPDPSRRRINADRYNRDGESVLYLSENDGGVVRECKMGDARADADRELWIQEYLIPASSLRIVDLSIGDEETLINNVMWFAEHAGDDPNPTKLFSRAIAELAARSFDGFLVRGTRGDDSFEYRNLVIFRPLGRWESWLAPGGQPRVLGRP